MGMETERGLFYKDAKIIIYHQKYSIQLLTQNYLQIYFYIEKHVKK